MVTENTLMKFGFVREKNELRFKEMIEKENKLKEIHIDVYPENPFTSPTSFMLLLRTSENNAKISIDDERIILKRNDAQETHFMNVIISKITDCFSKISDDYYEVILNVQNIYYKITVFNKENYMKR